LDTTGGFYCATSNLVTFSNFSINNNSQLSKVNNVNCTNSCSSNSICTSCSPECSFNGCPSNVYGLDCLSICPNCNFGTCNNTRNSVLPCMCNPGFDPATNCSDCLFGNWGPTCSGNCINCGNGYCNNTIKGNGKCICPDGFDPSIGCSNCFPTLFGETCSAVCFSPYCYGHGNCSNGIYGSGGCNCDSLYDPTTYCRTTIVVPAGSVPIWVIVIAILGSVLFLTIIVCAGFVWANKKMKRIHNDVIVGHSIHLEKPYEYKDPVPRFVMENFNSTDEFTSIGASSENTL